VDAPPTVYHIKRVFEQLRQKDITATINYPKHTMCQLIVSHGMPPTRIARYCCQSLKERKFKNQHLLMGIRWAESRQRKKRGLHESIAPNKRDKVVFMDENDNTRRLTEICQMRHTIATNPIIDWTDEQIWEYIKKNNIETNPLYEMGHKRVGCIGCPMAGTKTRINDFIEFPKYKNMYLKTFERMIEYNHKMDKRCTWNTPEEVFRWWLDISPTQHSFDDWLDKLSDYRETDDV
jgi:phosphoadenosine phosphosulfate reductase